jgi:hypothetical protein
MLRRLFTLLPALALVLLLALGLGWASSAAYDDVRVRWSGGRLLVIGTNAGVTHFLPTYFEPHHPEYRGSRAFWVRLSEGGDPLHVGEPPRHAGALGLNVYTFDGQRSPPDPSQTVPPDPSIAFAAIALHPALLALPCLVCLAAWVIATLRRRRRVRRGLCARCGYDLRATPGRCPEYGLPCGAGATQTT